MNSGPVKIGAFVDHIIDLRENRDGIGVSKINSGSGTITF